MKKDHNSKKQRKKVAAPGRGGNRPGAGRPGLAENVTKIQVNAPAELDARLREKADQAGLAYPAWLRDVLERAAR